MVALNQLQTYTVAFVVIGVVLSIGLAILGGVSDEINDSTAQEGADQAMEGLTTFTGWLPLIALVVVAAVIIGLVMRFGASASGSKSKGNKARA